LLDSSEEILAREVAIEAARRRMQEQYDLKAQEAAIKQKQVTKPFNFKTSY
jgi:hypothetical protein